MTIPQSEILSTGRMNRIFDNTVATYKFYWFASILDLFVQKGKTRINIWDIMVEMVVKAWYPACFFHISFGKSDSLYDAIWELHSVYQLPANIKTDDLRTWLHQHRETTHVRSLLRFLPQNVPYRFLRPWIDTSDDKAVVLRSQTYENGCPYSLHKEQGTMWVELNSEWLEYFQANYIVLHDFAYWNLALFLQARNPNVPNIPNKLIKSDTRNPLNKQHEYWDFVMQHGLDVHCIYTNAPLHQGEYDLDHFIPWSFVSHDLIWNLLPADGSINSSKSDKLPDLDKYLKQLALLQQQAVQTCLRQHDLLKGRILDFGCGFGYDTDELKRQGYDITGYDYYYRPEFPQGKFDTIICVYVLNVLEPYAQADVMMMVSNLLKPNGVAYYAVRRDLKEEGFRLHAIHKQHTYQCNVVLPFKSLVHNQTYELYQYVHFNKLPRSEKRTCPFCDLSRRVGIICETDLCVAFYDGYPVSPGHALIIPRRHVSSYFDLTNQEREAMNNMLSFVKQKVEEQYHPDGYNIGINVNEAAGQSVFHCHMHLIPRYKGDVENPKGGVRSVIPNKQKY